MLASLEEMVSDIATTIGAVLVGAGQRQRRLLQAYDQHTAAAAGYGRSETRVAMQIAGTAEAGADAR